MHAYSYAALYALSVVGTADLFLDKGPSRALR